MYRIGGRFLQSIRYAGQGQNQNLQSSLRRNCSRGVEGSEFSLSMECGNNQNLTFKMGRLAKFADGAAIAQMGETSVLVTAVSETSPTRNSFMPLSVDYRQKAAAAGRIPTNHLRRELGPTDFEILTSRSIDRSLRPMFPAGYHYETQLVCNLLAVDGLNDPDVIAINAASAALCVSDIPFNGPVGACRVAFIDGKAVPHPTRRQMASSSLDLIVSGVKHSKIVMLEASADNLCVQDFMQSVKVGMKEVSKIVQTIEDFARTHGKPKREVAAYFVPSQEMISMAETLSRDQVYEVLTDFSHDKLSRDRALSVVRETALVKLTEAFPEADNFILQESLKAVVKKVFSDLALDEEQRMDGRKLNDIRNIYCETNLFEPLHGSALFQRGQTQVMCTVSFDSPHSSLRQLDPVSQLLDGNKEKNFMLHYEFPPYATNETGRSGRIGRRELGHGNLAERALKPLVPKDFPFTIRLTSEVLESNGSSSMAAVCGGTLALLDAGVELEGSAAGIAMGLISESDPEDPKHFKRYKILTDILGIEDFLGEMDFKIAGSSKKITALQADVKIPGLPIRVVMETISEGIQGTNEILKTMRKTIPKARSKKKDNWPVVEKFEVPAHKRSQLVGLAGRNLRKITAETGVTLVPLDDNAFDVFAPNQTALLEAKEMMNSVLAESREPTLEFGGVYTAKIVEVRESGVMIQLYPNMTPTLLHNSQLDQRKVNHPSALGLTVGQEIRVKYYGRDPVSGHMRVSRKVLQATPSTVLRNHMSDSKSTPDKS
ncbi:polyribonucleotide nucleotidyltransferase 1, mitochondrial [Galendromus occidentalis]|uniref:polyribonucleotide nucleotidyltransferase n=1 Tax=Galendromus occidentalis TaxID=34638 RepID=A0AAJ6QRM7_9ACAR|nr:polyribonucleotide nucleotidyltransferase 1, mitochondrial [Galendromus occidentalis]